MFGEPGSAAYAHPWLTGFALGLAAAAAAILIWYLIRRPRTRTFQIQMLLALGFGALPVSAAVVGNAAGYQHSSHRAFCASCHVMEPYTADAANVESRTLASRHSRNSETGDASCYFCHRDYGMYSTVATKIGGLGHVWAYYTEWKDVPAAEALETIELYRPFSNVACERCHSMQIPGWRAIDEHVSMRDELAAGTVMCASGGCHGPAHPGRGGRR
jgi:cytochrome c-type protein NapC